MSLRSLLNQTVTLYPQSSYDSYGREVVGTGVNKRARVQVKSSNRLMPDGSVRMVDAIVYFDPSVSITVNDRVDYLGVKYKVIGKYVGTGGGGLDHHIKVELVKWLAT